MSKSAIYNDLFSTKIISAKEFIVSGEKPYNISINKILGNPTLFDNITLLTEHLIKNSKIDFDKICASSTSSIPYATNVAAGLEKGILYIADEGNDKTEKDNIKGITIEGGMNIDDRILLIETVSGNDFYLNNIIKKITKYGGNIIGVIILFNQCEGEYVNLVKQNEKIITVLNIYDIFNHLETNNKVDLFYSERVKFYCEKVTKVNIKKLLESDKKEEVAEVTEVKEVTEIRELIKEPFVGQ
jgi:orotate phosphoribosyltransferase